jgi:hypothetical protein
MKRIASVLVLLLIVLSAFSQKDLGSFIPEGYKGKQTVKPLVKLSAFNIEN